MQAELEQLLVLQDRQQKIKQIQTEIKNLPQQRENLEAQLTASAAALAALKHKGQHLEMDRKKLELDAGTRRESITRLKTQQYETRKNDEFRAMGNEIERYEKEIRAIEDQELELMDRPTSSRSRSARRTRKPPVRGNRSPGKWPISRRKRRRSRRASPR